MTNAEIRNWYRSQLARISELNLHWIAQGLTPEQRAREAWRIRFEARLAARAMMSDPAEVELLRARDVAHYGSPDGPTFDFLVEKARAAGFDGDALYEAIVESSCRMDSALNKKLGL